MSYISSLLTFAASAKTSHEFLVPPDLESSILREVEHERSVEVIEEDDTNPDLEHLLDDGEEDGLTKSFFHVKQTLSSVTCKMEILYIIL